MARFVEDFGSHFAALRTRGVTDGDDFVSSPSDDEIIRSIRERYIQDASLAIVLLGESTWTRRFVDWEIAAAFGGGEYKPLPVLALSITGAHASLPPRLSARPGVAPVVCVPMPATAADLMSEISAAGEGFAPGVRNPLARLDIRN